MLLHGIVGRVSDEQADILLLVAGGVRRPIPLDFAAIRTILPAEAPAEKKYIPQVGDYVMRKDVKTSRVWRVSKVKGSLVAIETEDDLLVKGIDEIEFLSRNLVPRKKSVTPQIAIDKA